MEKIDFVIPWVDGSDLLWRKEKNRCLGTEDEENATDNRFRDWNLLRYWFRGVEECTPWVNKIYFITYGHLPEWLNVENEKLVIVNHKDYIPQKYLPTFSSHPIELNIFRIKNLSEHFVYFNDDMFLLKRMTPEQFFVKGLPVDAYIETILPATNNDTFIHTLLNDIYIINKNFSKWEVVKKNFLKIFNIKYGSKNLNNLCLLPWKKFASFQITHLPQPFLKSVLEEVWEKENDFLDKVCKNKFRTNQDVNQYIFRYWQCCTGRFTPSKPLAGKGMVSIGHNDYLKIIEKNKYNCICLNDGDNSVDVETESKKIIEEFEKIFPDKCSFEK